MYKSLFVSLIVLLSALTAISQKMIVPGLSEAVTVQRDGRGIPYIDAKNDKDLYFAQGYITASDRLWQMDLMRRLARGETAEIFGSAVLEEDKRWRRFGFAEIAEQNLALLTPQLREALDSYARGVNAYIATLDQDTAPVEFKILQYKMKPWKPTDTIVVGKILADALSTTWRNDLLRASLASLPKEKFDDLNNQVTPYDVVLFGKDTNPMRKPARKQGRNIQPTIETTTSDLPTAEQDAETRASSLSRVGLYAEDLAASNNWVISSKRTADGKPILANDPHLQATAPGIWYMTELTSPTMHTSGVTFPGVPGIVLGHNENIAWGATNVGPDVQDLYVETFNEAGQYKTPTGWAKPTIRKETINVRSSLAKPDTTPVTIEIVETRNGVIVTEEGGKNTHSNGRHATLKIMSSRPLSASTVQTTGTSSSPHSKHTAERRRILFMPTSKGTSAGMQPAASRSAGSATVPCRMTERRPTATGRARSRSTNCRTSTIRRPASSSPPISGSPGPITNTPKSPAMSPHHGVPAASPTL